MPSVALAASANANAAAANAAAARAKRIACMKYVPGYEHDTATVTEMRQYAECVDILHPEPMTGGEVAWVKAAIVAGMIGAAAAAWIWGREEGIFGGVMGFLFGGISGAFAVGAAWFLIAAVRYLLT